MNLIEVDSETLPEERRRFAPLNISRNHLWGGAPRCEVAR
jgi:hypothetical protein